MGIKRKLYETIARHLKGGAWARVGRTKVWALGAERIRLVMKTYTFQARNVYVLGWCRICLLRPRCLVALVEMNRRGEGATSLPPFVWVAWDSAYGGRRDFPLGLVKAVHHAVRAPFYVGSPIIIRIFTPHTCSVQY